MLYLAIKAAISGIIVAIVSEVAKRYPGFGALIASLPLVSVLGMIWLWHDKPDVPNMAVHVQATFWFVLPSLPMFLLMPWLRPHHPPLSHHDLDRAALRPASLAGIWNAARESRISPARGD
jgi:hypothetical protein